MQSKGVDGRFKIVAKEEEKKKKKHPTLQQSEEVISKPIPADAKKDST